MLLFIEFYLLVRYRHIGILAGSEGDLSCVTNLEFYRLEEAINRNIDHQVLSKRDDFKSDLKNQLITPKRDRK